MIEQCQSNRVYLATFLRYDSVQPNLSRRQVSLIRDRAQSILHLLSDSQHRMEEQERLHETIGGLNDIPDCKCPYLMFLYYYYYTHWASGVALNDHKTFGILASTRTVSYNCAALRGMQNQMKFHSVDQI